MTKHIILVCMLSLATIASMAADFISNGIAYDILSASEKTLQVTYVYGDEEGFDELTLDSDENENYFYVGDLDIPQTVEYNGTKYTVVAIGDWAFWAAKRLGTITLPSTVVSIGQEAFENASGKEVIINGEIKQIGQWAFYAFGGKITNVTLSCETVTSSAFENCTLLEEVKLTNDVKTIEHHAFFNTGLKSISIPNSVTVIETNSFKYCYSLKSVTLPNNLVNVVANSFSSCTTLETITIPASVKSIETNAFTNNPNIKQILVKSTTPPTLGEAFEQLVYSKTLIVPDGTKDAYKTAPGWKKFFDNGGTIYDKPAVMVDVIPEPISGGTVNGNGIYMGGSAITVNAIPEDLYLFKEWKYDALFATTTEGNSMTFVLTDSQAKKYYDSDKKIEITAVFALKQFDLNIEIVNVEGNPVNWGHLILGESGRYDINTTQGIAAVAEVGYEFVNMVDENGNEISKQSAINLVMTTDKTVKAVFKEKQAYTVSLSIDGEGFGHVTGLKTSGRYLEGQDLDLTAIATTATESSTLNCHFVGWTVDGEDQGSDEELKIAEVTKNHVIVAKFEEDAKSALNLAKEGEGTVTFVNEKYTGTSVELYVGKTTAISAIPADHYTFTKWIASDNTEITSNPYVVSFGAEDVTYTAVFTEDAKNNLIVKSNIPEASDLVETTHEGLYKNETKTLSFTETTGYEFVRWDVEYANNAPSAASTDKTQTVTMGECDVTYTAIFQLKEYSITTSGNNCQITVNVNDEESNKATMNSDVDVIVNVAAGYKVKTITKNSQLIELEDGRYSFEMPTENLTFEVVCEPIEYIVSASNVINGNVTFSKNTAIVGEVIEISTAPEDGYIVGSITSEQVAISDNKFVMPSENVTINVTFVVDCERCQNAAQIKSVVDWILVVNKKAIESGDNTEVFDKAYDDLQDKDVEWYKVNGEKDDWCTGKQEEIGGVDERMAIGLYFTQDANSLIGTGDYYAVVTLRGTRCKCITSDIISYSSRSNKMVVTPTSAHQGQTMTISGLPEANAVVRITDVNGAVVKSFNTNGNETMTFEADNSNGIYVVSVIVEDVVKSVRYIVK